MVVFYLHYFESMQKNPVSEVISYNKLSLLTFWPYTAQRGISKATNSRAMCLDCILKSKEFEP